MYFINYQGRHGEFSVTPGAFTIWAWLLAVKWAINPAFQLKSGLWFNTLSWIKLPESGRALVKLSSTFFGIVYLILELCFVFQQILSTVDENAKKVLKMTSISRGHLLNDWYTIRNNNRNVQLWSIVLCCIIIASSAFQVYFVRRMFNVHGAGVRSASKPRA